jgi:hypothetical protein
VEVIKPSSTRTFEAPFAKTERAKSQIQELDQTIKSFFKSTPYQIVSQVDPEVDEETWRFQLTSKLPHELALRTGEIFHNLRSALDQMLAETVVRVSKRSETGVEFPFGLTINDFETSLRKQKKLPPDGTTMVRELKPYKGGDPLLWLLHSANRRDKHRMGLVPVNLRTAGKVSYLSLRYGQALVIGSRGGQHLTCQRTITDADYVRLAVQDRCWGAYGTSVLDPVSGVPLVSHPCAHLSFDNLGPGTAEESYEFFTATPGTKFKTDFEPTFDVAFRDVWGLERKPIVPILAQLRDLIEHVLLTFRDRFFPD